VFDLSDFQVITDQKKKQTEYCTVDMRLEDTLSN